MNKKNNLKLAGVFLVIVGLLFVIKKFNLINKKVNEIIILFIFLFLGALGNYFFNKK